MNIIRYHSFLHLQQTHYKKYSIDDVLFNGFIKLYFPIDDICIIIDKSDLHFNNQTKYNNVSIEIKEFIDNIFHKTIDGMVFNIYDNKMHGYTIIYYEEGKHILLNVSFNDYQSYSIFNFEYYEFDLFNDLMKYLPKDILFKINYMMKKIDK